MHSTINAQLQHDTEAALQEGLAHYEISTGRTFFRGPEANIADAVQKLEIDNKSGLPAWQQALQAVHLPLYDVHWSPAVVLEKGGKYGDGAIRVGLPDGRIVPLTVWSATIKRELGLYDVVYVNVVEPDVPHPGEIAEPRAIPLRPPPRRSYACGRRCKARRWSWRTRPAASWPWREAFPIR